MREETRASLATIEEVASLLISNAEEAECTQGERIDCEIDDMAEASDTPPDNLDAEFDRLLLAKNPSAAIRGMSDTKIVHLARYAQSRMEAEMGDAESEVQAQLQVSFFQSFGRGIQLTSRLFVHLDRSETFV